eukprot:12810400-Heterocapsa_arctica.AAC.1
MPYEPRDVRARGGVSMCPQVYTPTPGTIPALRRRSADKKSSPGPAVAPPAGFLLHGQGATSTSQSVASS